MIHLYCGDGKGKTTAACGLTVRAAGSGMRVLFVQFFKSGKSSEVVALEKLGIDTAHPGVHYGRYKTLNEEKKTEVRDSYGELFDAILAAAAEFDLIVLDEAVSAYNYAMIDGERLTEFLRLEGNRREIVLTGRNPLPELIELSDYVTEMKKVKHPFDGGTAARKGIEY
ncbi:MAG: cob(I)yrinic acid a,c-diamide adenosyltransferase [Clostridia bacterium]|nr:cob(I)yrinic acid a,c-diamide adenosyltransferase [Clostridia bacterium]